MIFNSKLPMVDLIPKKSVSVHMKRADEDQKDTIALTEKNRLNQQKPMNNTAQRGKIFQVRQFSAVEARCGLSFMIKVQRLMLLRHL
jgi:hypothetical protein